MTEENTEKNSYRKHLEDVASALPEKWKEQFYHFVETGEAEKPFLDFLDSSKAGQEAVEVIFKETSAAFERFAAVFRSLKSDTLVVGQQTADGVYAGLTLDGKQQIFAMPKDLSITMTFNDAAKAVKKLNVDKNANLGHNDWQIPALDNLHVLQKNQNEGALKGAFKTASPSGSAFPAWYWSSTADRSCPGYVGIASFSYGIEYWTHKNNLRLSCRPVHLVACKAP